MDLKRAIKRILDRVEKIIWARKAYRFHLRSWTQLSDLNGAAQLLNTARFSRVLKPVVMTGPVGKKICVIAPHPDDEIIGPGGTLLGAGPEYSISIIYLTSGSAEEKPLREAESRELCSQLKWKTTYLDFKVGEIGCNFNEADNLYSALLEAGPDVVMLPFVLDDNDDHRRANELFCEALSSFGAAQIKEKTEIWAYQVYSAIIPNVVVDITDVHEQKAACIKQYASQMRHRDWVNFSLGLNAWSSRWLSGVKTSAWAESFFVLPCEEYIELLDVYFNAPGAKYYS